MVGKKKRYQGGFHSIRYINFSPGKKGSDWAAGPPGGFFVWKVERSGDGVTVDNWQLTTDNSGTINRAITHILTPGP
jgi:hypothetical protein